MGFIYGGLIRAATPEGAATGALLFTNA